MAEEVIRVHDLTKVYGKAAAAVRALDGFSFSARAGEMLTLFGPSGSGKTTLLNILAGLEKPSGGEVSVGGQSLAGLKDADAFRAKNIGFIFRSPNLLPVLSVRENIEAQMRAVVAGGSARRRRSESLLGMLGLTEVANLRPDELSNIQCMRVAVGRAMANDPALLLADEPTGDLDSRGGKELLELLTGLNERAGVTILIATHERSVAQAAPRVLHIADGRLVGDRRPDDALQDALRLLAESEVGGKVPAQGAAARGLLSAEEQAVLRRLLEKVTTDAGGVAGGADYSFT